MKLSAKNIGECVCGLIVLTIQIIALVLAIL